MPARQDVTYSSSGRFRRFDGRLVLVALAPVVLWSLLLVGFDNMFWSMVSDDSFYYWQIGRNLARGLGSTFDGLTLTNGYHPLWMAFCASLFAAGLDGEVAPRVSLLVQILLLGAAWWLLSASVVRVLREVRRPAQMTLEAGALGVLFVVGLSQPLVKVWVNGLESAFVLIAQAGLVSVAAGTDRLLAPAGRRVRVLTSVLVAVSFLARTDGALLLPAIVLWALPMLRANPRRVTVWLVEWLALPTLVVGLYMFVNHAIFGSAVQVSGLLKFAPFEPWRIAGALAVLVGPWLVMRRLDLARWPRLRLTVQRTGFFGMFCLMLVAYYGFLQAFARVWYLGPILLYATLLGAVALADLQDLAALERSDRPPRRALRPFGLAFGVLGSASVVFGVAQAITAPAAAPLLANRDAGRYIAHQLPPGAILAAWDAGVVGYFSERRLVNLDGVVNSVAYVQAMRTRTTAAYLSDIPIGWVVNHSGDEESVRRNAIDYLGPRAEEMTLVRSWPFDVFAGVNGAVPQEYEASVFLFSLNEPEHPE